MKEANVIDYCMGQIDFKYTVCQACQTQKTNGAIHIKLLCGLHLKMYKIK